MAEPLSSFLIFSIFIVFDVEPPDDPKGDEPENLIVELEPREPNPLMLPIMPPNEPECPIGLIVFVVRLDLFGKTVGLDFGVLFVLLVEILCL